MSNGDGNPNIGQLGVTTRFGQPGGPDPSVLAREKNTAHVRAALRRLAAAEFDITKQLTPEELVKKFGREGTVVTGAMMIAIRKFQKAMQGDVKMLQQVTDDIDGKQTQALVEAQVTLADLVNKSYELEGE